MRYFEMTNSPYENSQSTLFQDQVVLITGAGKGAGRALALALARRGAVVAANDISPVNLDEVVAQIRADGGNAAAYVDDIAKKVTAQALIKNVVNDLGRIDILIHHAAVEPHTPLLDMDEWDWHRTLDVNLTGAFLMIQSAGRIMRAQGHGMIISIIAATGRAPGKQAAAYAAGMAGLAELSAQADRELRPYGIRVYAVPNPDHETTVLAVISLLTQEDQ